MKVHVHCKEKTITVQCGEESNQRILWLAHVGIARYDTNFGIELGIPTGVQNAKGELLDSDAPLNKLLQENDHVWILFKGDEPQIK